MRKIKKKTKSTRNEKWDEDDKKQVKDILT